MHSYLIYAIIGRTFGGLAILLAVGLWILTVVAQWRIFEKAGHEGILALIPIVNVIILCDIAQVSPWIIVLFFIPILNVFAMLYLDYSYVAAFGFDFGGFLLYLFFGGLMEIYMAFSDDVQYIG